MSDYDEGRVPFFFHLPLYIPYFYRRLNQRIVRIEIE